MQSISRMICSFGSLLKTPTTTLLNRELHFLESSRAGNPYKTQIKRKRVVEDLCQPKNLYSSENKGLMWADWKMLKDLKARHVVSLYYPTRMNLLTVFRSPHLPKDLRMQAREDLMHSLPRKSVWGALKTRCSITSRRRGRLAKYRVSRFVFRALADNNKLSGVIKSKWGP